MADTPRLEEAVEFAENPEPRCPRVLGSGGRFLWGHFSSCCWWTSYGGGIPGGIADHPVVNVDNWNQARAYCGWASRGSTSYG